VCTTVHFDKARAAGSEDNFSMGGSIFYLKGVKNAVAILDEKFGFLGRAIDGQHAEVNKGCRTRNKARVALQRNLRNTTQWQIISLT
jgi:hypothetical protein